MLAIPIYLRRLLKYPLNFSLPQNFNITNAEYFLGERQLQQKLCCPTSSSERRCPPYKNLPGIEDVMPSIEQSIINAVIQLRQGIIVRSKASKEGLSRSAGESRREDRRDKEFAGPCYKSDGKTLRRSGTVGRGGVQRSFHYPSTTFPQTPRDIERRLLPRSTIMGNR